MKFDLTQITVMAQGQRQACIGTARLHAIGSSAIAQVRTGTRPLRLEAKHRSGQRLDSRA